MSPNINEDVTRRDFIKTSAVAGATTVLTGSLSHRAHAQGSDTIKVGVVGCGGRGIFAGISDCAQSAPGVEVHAIGDLFKERIDTVAGRFKQSCEKRKLDFNKIYQVTPATMFHGWNAYQQVINNDVDMVIFTSPPYFRPEQLRACVAAGKHAFVEKPIAVDPVGVRFFLEQSELAKQKGLTIVAGTQMRRASHLRALMPRLHDGAIGTIHAGQSARLGGDLVGHLPDKLRKAEWSDMEWQIRRWLFYTWLSGDFIVEQHVHNLDLINWAMDAHPTQCTALGGRQTRTGPTLGNIYDHFTMQYDYPNGARVIHLARQQGGCSGANSMSLQGPKGTVNFDFGGAKIIGENAWEYKGPRVSPAIQEYTEMIAAIRNNQPLNDGQQVAETTMTAILGRISAYTGRAVKWNWVMKSSKLDLSPPQLAFGPVPERPVAMPGTTKLI
jgi:predicted dehydrogenase